MSETNNIPLIELTRVSKKYSTAGKGSVTILDDISFVLRPGEIVAVVGKSGCGKSTLLRTICGLIPIDNGVVLYRGKPITEPVATISMVFQNFALFPWLNILQNVELGLEAQGILQHERRQRALKVIDMIGLDGFESAYPKEMSGGMCQRVGFARALVVNPDVLLMDEAFSSLDVPTAETLRNDLLDLWLERRIPTQAILMVSHNIEEALFLANRMIILDTNPGRIKAEIEIPLKHPRDRESAPFRQMMNRIYSIMTTAVVPNEAEFIKTSMAGVGYRLPSVTVAHLAGMLEEINQPANNGVADLPSLAEAMQMEVDDLFPILEVCELLDYARVSGGKATLTQQGNVFAEADIQRRKVIFGEHLLKRVPLITHIRRVLDDRPSQSAPESRFLRELEDYLAEEEAQRVLSVVIDWGRYAELFAYDYNSGIFSKENPGEETAPQ